MSQTHRRLGNTFSSSVLSALGCKASGGFVMSRSLVINALPIFGLLIVSTVLSASREELIAQPHVAGERHITRQAEVLEASVRRFRNDGPDVRPQEHEFLHRLARLAKESIATKSAETNSSRVEKKSDNSTLSVDKLEVKDMMETHVTPRDDDDVDASATSEKTLETTLSDLEGKSSEPKAKNSTGKLIVTTASPPPAVFPDDNTTAEIRIATPEWYAKLNMTRYTTNGSNANSTPGAATASVLVVTMSPLSDTRTKVKMPVEDSTTTATMTDEPTTATVEPTPSSPSPEEMKLHQKKTPEPKPMPSGVAALIAAISFAMIVVVVYVGILIRKRYFEWRYGNRELLVNDFDAADMSNFEL